MRPPSLDQLPALFAGGDGEPPDSEVENSRTNVIALLQTVDPRLGGRLIDSLAPTVSEKSVVRNRREAFKTQKVCRYCEMQGALRFGLDKSKWKAVSTNHAAKIETRFDPNTCVSEGSIQNFQALVPDLDSARRIVDKAHPLRWAEAAPTLFLRSESAELRKRDWYISPRERESEIDRWSAESGTPQGKHHYLYESVNWPWNEYVGAAVENIIKIANFHYEDNGRRLALSYQYSLESCLRSSFGVSSEAGGLDIDRGEYSAQVARIGNAADDYALADARYSNFDGDLQLSTTAAIQRNTLDTLARKLKWKDAHIVTISASKALRYTMPNEAPQELRGFLNATAPALISTFLTRSFCDAVYLI